MKKLPTNVFALIIAGAKNIAPIVLTFVAVRYIVLKVMELLGASSSFAYSTEYLKSHPWMYALLLVMAIGVCFVFGIAFGKSRDIYIDNFFGNVPGINKIYNFFNGFFTFQKKAQKGQSVYIPYYNKDAYILCYIMGTSKINICDIPHYRINIPPAAALMGGHLVMMRCDYIDQLIEQQKNCLPSSEDAFKINLSIGAAYPEQFKFNETVTNEEK